MRAISKGPEPASLTAHRKNPHSDYDNYAAKAELRDALVTEQRGLCCYCMGRISSAVTSLKIEHWRCRSRFPHEELNYRNLLAACLGGEGQPRRLQHCDTRKGDGDLRWNPANLDHHIETRLRYESDGSIRSDDLTFDAQLRQVLNLNLAVLKNNRKGVRDAVLELWNYERKRYQGPVLRARLERIRDRQMGKSDLLHPYWQVAVWWLDQRLRRMTA